MNRIFVVTVALVFSTSTVTAEESRVYESMTNVKIGRVFISQAEREGLDARRHLPPQNDDTLASTETEATSQVKPRPSAGYFKSSKGPSRVWKDGDFVSSDVNENRKISFPGDVKITRHSEAKQGDGDDE